jgi:DNA-binding LytR/AlgR family response regulator
MQVLIIEDEPLASERIRILLEQYDEKIIVLAILESIEQSILWLTTKKYPDLIIIDIELSDGKSFEIFKQVHYNGPIIFTTAYSQFALDAFKYNSIAYILKPVTLASLATALQKLKIFSTLATYEQSTPIENFSTEKYKSKFLAKVGQRLFFINTSDIACFLSENKILYIIDKENNKFIINSNIEKIESQIDPKIFFRPNRKTIINYTAIDQIKPYYNNRLKVLLKIKSLDEEIIISRERVSVFKQWADS